MDITKDFTFEASHVLPRHPGKCSRLHGHSWKLSVTLRGSVDDESGFVMDYGTLKAIVNEQVLKYLDHAHLGRGYAQTFVDTFQPPTIFPEDFYPSSENLVVLIRDRLLLLLPELLYSITLHETCTSAATWTRGVEHA